MKKHVKTAIKLSKLTPEQKVVKAQAVVDAMQNSGYFANANMPVSYSSLNSLISNLHQAIITAANGTTADTSAMHDLEKMLIITFNLVRSHIEMVANNSVDPNAVIVACGLSVVDGSGSTPVTELTLEAVGNGSIQIRVPRASDEKAFHYQFSSDGGTTWQTVIFSPLAKVTFKNQTPGATLHIRYASITKEGLGNYSVAKSIMVV